MTSSEWPSPLAARLTHAAWAAFGWVLWTGVRVMAWCRGRCKR